MRKLIFSLFIGVALGALLMWQFAPEGGVRGSANGRAALVHELGGDRIDRVASGSLVEIARVVDGDTIDVKAGGKTLRLRLIGIDTPEIYGKKECYGKEASVRAKEMLEKKRVRIERESAQEEDRYQRILAYVFLEDGTFFNQVMISEGYAREYTYAKKRYKYQSEFQAREREAREEQKGLWGACKSLSTIFLSMPKR